MMFETIKTEISANTHHYRLVMNDRPVSFQNVLELWQHDQVFLKWFCDQLTQSPFQAFRWETPVLTRDKLSRDFEYVLVEAGSFVHRRTDRQAFDDYFKNDPVVSFPNLGGDGLMIVPCPQISEDVYGHFAAFLRGGPNDQILALWKTVGTQVSAYIGDTPKWLSTAGGGVAWLHVRLDCRPKYYHYQPYRDVNYV